MSYFGARLGADSATPAVVTLPSGDQVVVPPVVPEKTSMLKTLAIGSLVVFGVMKLAKRKKR